MLSRPQRHSAIGRILCKFKIEPATYRFVAHHLNHCATAVPQVTQRYPECRGTSRLLIVFRTVRHSSLSYARRIRSPTPIFIFLRYIYSYIQIFRVLLLSSSFCSKACIYFSFLPYQQHTLLIPTIPDVIILIMCGEIIFMFISAVKKIRLELFV